MKRIAFFIVPLFSCSGEPPDSRDTGVGEDTGSEVETDEPPPFQLANGEHLLQHEGLERTFRLYRPDDLVPNAPLVIVMHGYGGTAEGIEGYSGFNTVAEREGFAVVYPQGTTDAWSATYWEVEYAFHDQSVDDVGFVRALVETVGTDLGTDRSRVYASGISNGGDMSYRLVCEADDLVAAIAPVAGCLMVAIRDGCSPSSQPDILEIHGTADRITPWDGDIDGSDGYGPYLGTEATVGHFVDQYGLDQYEETELPDTNSSDGSTVTARKWTSPAGSPRVWLYQIEGGGHDWPGASGNRDIDTADAAWSFFKGTTREN